MRWSIALLMAGVCSAQTYTIHTFAGGGAPENTLCTTADLFDSSAIAADSAGNLFLAVTQNGTVVRCDAATGVLTRVAGTGVNGFSSAENLPAVNVRMSSPLGLALDSSGNLYIAEAGRVRRVSNRISTTVAGVGVPSYGGDGGPAASAQIDPAGIAVDAVGNLYIADGFHADYFNWRVRKVSNGIITTIAGGGDGTRSSNTIQPPVAVAADPAGNVYFADHNGFVSQISNRAVTLVAGLSAVALAVDSAGNLYAAGVNAVQKLSAGVVTTLSKTPAAGIAVDGAGNLYFTDTSTYVPNRSGNSIRRIRNGNLTTLLTGYKNADRGAAAFAQFATPYGLAVDSLDNVYFTDRPMNRVREISGGTVTTIAGNGTPGFSGDGSAASDAQLSGPSGIAVDVSGAVYIVHRTLLGETSPISSRTPQH